jgi:hypothetical protein
MASFVSSGWQSGATVSVYAQDAFGNATGSAVTSGAASAAGQVTFTGLAANGKYVASSGARSLRFQAPAPATSTYDGLPGIFAPSSGAMGGAGTALTANQAYVARFVPVEGFTATAIGFGLSTVSATDDPCDVGIYDAALNRLVSSGATTGRLNGATGGKSVPIAATALTAGTVYYAAFAANSAASLVFASIGSFAAAQIFGAAVPDLLCASKAASYPLPAALSGMSAVGSAPLLGVKK